jgi:U3 small nucleolar RNA-associated protein 25
MISFVVFFDRLLVFVILVEWLNEEYLMQLNHVFRIRDLVTKNDSKLAKHPEIADSEIFDGDSFRDQGFTRPKVV